MPRTASRRTSRRTEPDNEKDDYLDEPDEDTPRRGRRRDADAEPDEDTSRSRTRRNRFADDEPDDEPEDQPDEDDDRATRSSRRSRSSEKSRDDRGSRSERGARKSRPSGRERGGRGDRDKGSRSSRGERGGRSSGQSQARKGWGGYRETADSVRSDFADNLKIVDNTDMLVKILDEEPVASYAEHWLTLEGGRRSFVCLGADCPICNKLGDRPSVKVCFNVADMDTNPPEVKMWTFGTQVGDILEKFAENEKTSPVNRDDIYWTITRTKKNDRYTTTVRPVKSRDLVEDFDTDPLTEEELDELEQDLFTEDQIYTVKTKAELNRMIEENDLDDQY